MGRDQATTKSGQRLLWFFQTDRLPSGRYWPRAFDARLAERIVETFVPDIEVDAGDAECAAIRAAWDAAKVTYGPEWSRDDIIAFVDGVLSDPQP